ncbi:MAG: hypothetical protein JNM84_13365 [Planctomycetes bacterium]|nr:hypothetical protein [Planctomycetota bacterium]
MSFFGLSPAALLLGALALLAALFALHLLRVRLRRVEVDTLLFFERSGSVRQPRALLGSPSRWLAFLLAALALLATWLAWADPRTGLDRPARFVVIEPATGALLEQRLDEAERWVRERGLGPRGAVIAAAATPTPWLASDEPLELLRARATSAAHASDGAAHARAFALLATRALAGDEVVWIGGPAPAHTGAFALREARIEAPLALKWSAASWSHSFLAEPSVLQLELEGRCSEALTLALADANGSELARAEIAAGVFSAKLDSPTPRVEDPSSVTLRVLRANAELGRFELPVPSARKQRIAFDPKLDESLARALRAILALDPRCEPSADFGVAELVIAPEDDANDPRPRLVLTTGVGGGERQAELARTAPFALSLRDRARRDAPALAEGPGTPWVEDLRQGAALARATAEARGPRVEIATWLLEPATHADTPRLLAGALEFLAGRTEVHLAPASGALEIASGIAGTASTPAALSLANAGRVRFASARDAARALALPRGSAQVALLEDLSAGELPAPSALENARAESTSHGGSGRWIAPLLALAFLLLLVDAYAFHRGRLP